jgi:hypothetical protein
MKDKKNIDKFFDDSFKNFEATPSPRVWENIQAELNKDKKDRKVIPLWIKYGGIAALLTLLLTVGNWVFNPIDSLPNAITNENIEDSVEKTQINTEFVNPEQSEIEIATENTNIENAKNNSPNEVISTNDEVFNKQNNQQSVINSTKTIIASNGNQTNISKKKANQHNNLNTGKQLRGETDKRLAISQTASNLPSKSIKSNNYNNSSKEKEVIKKNNKTISEEVVDRVAVSESSEENRIDPEALLETNNKKSILDAIAEKEKTDDNLVETEKQKPQHRWNVTPNVAPVYYSSFGNGSSIDPDFAHNPQKGDVNMSYGLQVSYALSNRLSVRSGINNVDLSYSTSDIVIGTGPVSKALSSVDYGGKQVVVTAINRSTLNSSGYPTNGFGDITLKSTSGDARLIQSINYYEVPVELKYAVLDSKFGLNIIGGVSTLFLGNNEISVKSDNFSSVLGEANNLSNVSFSTNVGLGLDYKLSKKFIFNIEPMFKYQLNPYTDSSVNYKPYYLGVYSGLSFKF